MTPGRSTTRNSLMKNNLRIMVSKMSQSGAMILPILAAVLAAASNQPAEFHFVTAEHEISMKVEFPEAYRGIPLAFFGGDTPARRCLPEHCIDRFYRAVAVVNFRVAKANPKAQKPAQLREVVTIVEQSADLPVTPCLDLTKKVVNGKIGDIQLLGYDEDGIPTAERDRMRWEAPARMWRKGPAGTLSKWGGSSVRRGGVAAHDGRHPD